MAWEFIEHGDAEAAIVDIFLNETPELTPFGIARISTSMTGYTLGDRWIFVTQEGGSEDWPAIDRPRIDVEVYAERRSVARDIAAICLASVKYNMGTYRGFGLFLSDAKVEQGLTRIPDKFQEETRYYFSLRLTTRPSGSLTPPS